MAKLIFFRQNIQRILNPAGDSNCLPKMSLCSLRIPIQMKHSMKKALILFGLIGLLLLPLKVEAPSSYRYSETVDQGLQPVAKSWLSDITALRFCPVGGILVTLEEPVLKKGCFETNSSICFNNLTDCSFTLKWWCGGEMFTRLIPSHESFEVSPPCMDGEFCFEATVD